MYEYILGYHMYEYILRCHMYTSLGCQMHFCPEVLCPEVHMRYLNEATYMNVFLSSGVWEYREKTIENIAKKLLDGALKTSNCDNGDYTAAWFIN